MTSRPPFWCPKQRKGGHVDAPTKSSGNLTLLLCKRFLLFSLKNMAVDHVSENQQLEPARAQSRTQSPRASRSAGERPEILWDNRLHFPRKRGFRSYDICLSLNGSRKEKTVNSRNGGLKVFEKQ